MGACSTKTTAADPSAPDSDQKPNSSVIMSEAREDFIDYTTIQADSLPTGTPATAGSIGRNVLSINPIMKPQTVIRNFFSFEGLNLPKDETYVFSCLVKKKNSSKLKQERTILITNKHFFNIIDPQEEKRRSPLANLRGITKSTMPKSYKFIIHFKDTWDYWYEVDSDPLRTDIFDAIKEEYFNVRVKIFLFSM